MKRDKFMIGIRLFCGVGAVAVFYFMVTKPQAEIEQVAAYMVFTFVWTRLADIAAGVR